ncbi:Glycogen synthase kinase-3 beta [Thelohanellus kitauei]|uniref:Glycogen synthase kinase-3 beta n=1 Tax=Thelohanellus kitauei TaxID=669202 RepID=A0A0C2MQJ1_THEKT|nr:Glycogen synthase kinase-3 beta [Thelohanellus kitauei]
MKLDANNGLVSNGKVDPSADAMIPRGIFEVYTKDLPDRPVNILLSGVTRISHGTFGVVYRADMILNPKRGTPSSLSHRTPSERVALKTVYQDARYKNRELEIGRILNHPNIIQMKYYFKIQAENGSTYLGLIMEYCPISFQHFMRDNVKSGVIPQESVLKKYAFQLISGIDYIHVRNICHRDIKPQNILLSEDRNVLKICDFGSAKRLVQNESNVAYICSRHYRAPELIAGVSDYTTAVDIWSCGCVIAEAYSGVTLFNGDSSLDQMRKILFMLELPQSYEGLLKQNNHAEIFECRPTKGILNKRLKCKYKNYVALAEEMLSFHPFFRPTSTQLLAHEYFK